MEGGKLKRVVAFSILFVLSVFISLSFVSAVITNSELSVRGNGLSEISTNWNFSGSESVKLYAPKITDFVNSPNWHEARININFDTPIGLNKLENISWETNVTIGYAPHVDVFLDNGETLTFEYAKVDPNDCDNSTNYPSGEINTFGDKGIIDNNTYAWESIPGPCGNPTFNAQHKSLAGWKSFYPNVNVSRIEIEVDGWIEESEAYLDDVRINSNLVELFDEIPPALNPSNITGTFYNGTDFIFSPANQDGVFDNAIIIMNASELVDWGTTRIYNSTGDSIKLFFGPSGFIILNNETWTGGLLTANPPPFVPDGIYTINTTLTDIANNTNEVFVATVFVDNTGPQITIAFPQNISYAVNVSELNYTVSDIHGVSSCWYSLNNGVTNTTITCGQNATGLTSNENSNTWTVYSNDSLGNINSSSITFFKDTINPLISYGIETENNNANLSQNWIYVNVTVTELNEDTIIFSLHNSTDLVNSSSFTNGQRAINFTNLQDGIYTYNVTVNDTSGNSNTTEKRTITLDTTAPTLNYVSPTESSGVFRNQNYIEVNVTTPDIDLDTIVIRLYNSTNDLINSSITTSSPNYINFSGLSDGIYYYNATANDTLGQEMNLETRNTTLDTINPEITITEPQNINYTTDSLQINFIVSDDNNLGPCLYTDNDGATNYTLTGCANTTYIASQGTTTITLYVKDIAGNENSSSVTFFVDSISPNIVGFSPSESTPVIKVGESQEFSITTAGNTLNYQWFVNNVSSGSANTYTYNSAVAGDVNISVIITDVVNNTASKTWNLIVTDIPVARTFTGDETTNLSQVNVSAVFNLTLENNYGKINFLNQVLDLTDVLDLDNFVIIQNGIAAIDSTKYPQLNKKAIITLEGVTYNTIPKILYTDSFTNDSSNINLDCDFCTILNFDPVPTSNGVVVFEVDRFSSFLVGESGQIIDLDSFEDLDRCILGEQGNLKINLKDPKNNDEFDLDDTIDIEIEVENTGVGDVDVIVEAILFNIDQDDEEEKEKSNDENIEPGEEFEFELEIEIPSNIEEDDDYILFVKVYEETKETTNCNQTAVEVRIEREKHDVVIKNIVLNPQIVSRGDNLEVLVEAENIGSSDEDSVYITLRNDELGFTKKSEFFDLEEHGEDDNFVKVFIIKIPEDAESGNYELTIRVDFDDGSDEKKEPFSVSGRILLRAELTEELETQETGSKSTSASGSALSESEWRFFAWLNIILVMFSLTLIVLIFRLRRR